MPKNMRTIKTLRDALKTIDRGCIVDADENRVPQNVVEALRNHAANYQYRSRIRYEGSREIWWFSR